MCYAQIWDPGFLKRVLEGFYKGTKGGFQTGLGVLLGFWGVSSPTRMKYRCVCTDRFGVVFRKSLRLSSLSADLSSKPTVAVSAGCKQCMQSGAASLKTGLGPL